MSNCWSTMKWLLLLLSTASLSALPVQKEPSCGYQSCPVVHPTKLNVHIIGHTHDDVGWLKTVDQYYYGHKNMIQKAGVQYIIDSIVTELLNHPNRRFIYVETAFLWKWWQDRSEEWRGKMRQLVNSGQLEIVSGAWSMNDEAAAHYHSLVDQFAWGLRKLNDTLGQCGRPHAGWQIDPFGHSREMASLLSQMGYDGLFFGRLDYQDKSNRLQTKTMEVMWEASQNLGPSANLFTHALYNTYSPPPGFCFDVLCADDPVIDDNESPDYNVDIRTKQLSDYIHRQALYYRTNNIILTMGGDFTYQNAGMWYTNLDKLIRYINEDDETVHAFYSTPGCYLKTVSSLGQTWEKMQDDFFPYASDPHTYWTGYFTSRPTSKYFERQGNNFLQVCKQLHSLAQLSDQDEDDIDPLREAMGMMQHHDAITGTEKQAVAADYARILFNGFSACQNVVNKGLQKLTEGNSDLHFSSCLLQNVSQCIISEISDNFVITVYNPLSRPVNHHVRLPISGGYYSVRDSKEKEQAVQIVPIPNPVLSLPERTSSAKEELVFTAVNIPPLGFRSYYVRKLMKRIPVKMTSKNVGSSIKNEHVEVKLDPETGYVSGLVIDGEDFPMEQTYMYYHGFRGNNIGFQQRSSGAYIFRPDGSPRKLTNHVINTIHKGEVVQEIHQQFSDWVSQVVRIYSGESHVEFEWLVGPIPVNDGIGKEVISRFTTKLDNKDVFYTDANGREMIRRKRNFRPTWQVHIEEPVSGNYYPVTSRIVIKDEGQKKEFAVLNDRAQGGSSLTDGQLELMIHRRLLYDDAFGVEEALNEIAYGRGLVARGRHYVIAGSVQECGKSSLAAQQKLIAQQKLLSPWIQLSQTELTFEEYSKKYNMEYSGLIHELPANIQILTLEPWKKGTLLLRLEHIFESNDDPELSKPVTINMEELFPELAATEIEEMTLDGNQVLSELQKLKWTRESLEAPVDDLPNITLTPMQIRTFVLKFPQAIALNYAY